jgi:spermidine/putrescine transport system permease protein
VLNGILMGLGIVHHPVNAFLFNNFSVILALTHLCTPFALVPIFAVMEQIPRALHSAAGDLYAPRARTFWHVTLPLAAHGILAGASFAFILSFGDYYAPALIGGPGDSLIGNIASSEFGASFQWPLGAALGLVMFGVVMLVLAIPVLAGMLLRRRSGGRPMLGVAAAAEVGS